MYLFMILCTFARNTMKTNVFGTRQKLLPTVQKLYVFKCFICFLAVAINLVWPLQNLVVSGYSLIRLGLRLRQKFNNHLANIYVYPF